MTWFDLAEEITPQVKRGNTRAADHRVADILGSTRTSPFHRILELDFTNRPEDVAAYFDDFLRARKATFQVGAVYTEANGFDINPDRWYFDVFGYREYGGQEDYAWLGDYYLDEFPDMTLTGLETLQAVYDSDAFRKETHRRASQFCSLLVVCKFQDLVRRSVPFMRELTVPLLATAHEYTFVAEFRKRKVRRTKRLHRTPQ